MTDRDGVSDDLEPRLGEIELGRLRDLEQIVEHGLQTFVEVGRALREIRDQRLYRQTHSTFEAYLDERWGMGRAHGYRLIDGARVAELVSPMGDIPNERQARELAPLMRDAGEQAVVDVWHELRGKYGDSFTADLVRRTVANRLERDLREQAAVERRAARRAALDEAVRAGELSLGGVEVGDVRTWTPGEPVDAIVTDPPYVARDDEPDPLAVYAELAAFALRCLRPGGALVVMTWQPILADVLDRLRVGDLRYSWACAWQFATHASTVVFPYRVFDRWKPVLVFHRGEPDPERPYFQDAFTNANADKDLHEWGQSLGGFRQIVRSFAHPGSLVCDPFAGAGTTGVAALAEGCRFVGCDRDAATVELARSRLALSEAAV